MRGLTAALAAAVAVALAAVGAPQASVRPILFVGDSLTVGFYASSPGKTYPAIVSAQLGRPGRLVATGGVTASHFATRASYPKASVVVVELGTNDYEHQTPLGAFDRAYEAVVAHVRRANPTAKLICVAVWSGSYTNPGWTPSAKYDAKIRGDCTGGKVANVTSAFDVASDRGPQGSSTPFGVRDQFHPNDAGHAAIAASVLGALRSVPTR
jgi:lysophospholipase L1-like esterase